MSADELWEMPSDNMRHELVKGELRTMVPSGGEHGWLVMQLAAPLLQYVKRKRLGWVVGADVGFVLTRNPDTVRAPDAAFISKTHFSTGGLPKKFVPFAPDLAVEIISPSERAGEVQEKVDDYLNSGCEMVWLIYPTKKTVIVHRPKQRPKTLTEKDILSGADVVPGFEIPVGEIFEE